MSYYLLLVIHLLCAFVFVGTVFFEVLILESVRKKVPKDVMARMEQGIGNRARSLMPWVLLALYGAGLGLAWHYRAALSNPFSSPFGTLLLIKIVLATSVFGHFLAAMRLRKRGRLAGTYFRRIHLSVFLHMVAIVLLAKGMFHLSW